MKMIVTQKNIKFKHNYILVVADSLSKWWTSAINHHLTIFWSLSSLSPSRCPLTENWTLQVLYLWKL